MTTIAWTEKTWNIVTGCDDVDEECDNCYACILSARLALIPGTAEKYAGVAEGRGEDAVWTGRINLHPNELDWPLRRKKPIMIFVNSMSDTFHKDVPDEFIDRIFAVMERANHHVYQVLTKRSSRMRDYIRRRYGADGAPPHIWLGVSVGMARVKSRIQHLRDAPAAIRFVSFEPLLDDVGEVDLTRIHWAIVGGESKKRKRTSVPMDVDWARSLRDQCASAGVAFFMKQLGGHPDKREDVMLFPEDLRIREYPTRTDDAEAWRRRL